MENYSLKLNNAEIVVINRIGGIKLKKYVLFVGIFSVAFIVLQLVSGMLLTMLYTPSVPWEGGSTLSSQVEFGHASFIPPLLLALFALGIAFGTNKMINRKAAQ